MSHIRRTLQPAMCAHAYTQKHIIKVLWEHLCGRCYFWVGKWLLLAPGNQDHITGSLCHGIYEAQNI